MLLQNQFVNRKWLKIISNFGTIFMGIICFLLYQQTLVTTKFYFLIIVFLSILFEIICRIIKGEDIKYFWDAPLTYVKRIILLYFCFFSFLFILKLNMKSIIVRIPIKGSYTHQVDGVIFDFNGYTYDRKIELNGIDPQYLLKNYNLELVLKQPLPNIYFVEDILLVPVNAFSSVRRVPK